mmetsp:Transcript_84818/g.221496  ORF Transcript_84818/g.221496 Transcript_84818/m.221496 type:complete len:223 (-) Transcript_84818:724-1392(-)
MSSARLYVAFWYSTGLAAYSRQASLNPASTVAAEPLQDRHLLSMVITGVTPALGVPTPLPSLSFPRGVSLPVVRTPPSMSGSVHGLCTPGGGLPSPALYPKRATLLRSWSSCQSSAALTSRHSTSKDVTALSAVRAVPCARLWDVTSASVVFICWASMARFEVLCSAFLSCSLNCSWILAMLLWASFLASATSSLSAVCAPRCSSRNLSISAVTRFMLRASS